MKCQLDVLARGTSGKLQGPSSNIFGMRIRPGSEKGAITISSRGSAFSKQ
jgi:hypothetical protein